MRTTFNLAFSALLLIAATVCAQSKPALGERDVKKLIEEYVVSGTTDQRRAEITMQLRTASPLLAQRTLKTALGEEAKRPYALDLALQLRVPGLFDTAKKAIDTVDEEKIVKLGFLTNDKGAVDFLFDRWGKSDASSASFGFVQSGFESNCVGLETIQKFKAVLTNAKAEQVWKDSAAKVIKFQLGLESDDQNDMLKNWAQLEADYKRDAQAFSITGTNMFEVEGVQAGGNTRRVGPNYRIPAGGSLTVKTLEEWDSGSFTITVRVRINEGDGASVGLSSEQGVWRATFSNNEWVTKSGDQTQAAVPGKVGLWATFVFTVKEDSEGGRKLARTCNLTVDGKALITYGTLNGKLLALQIDAGKASIVAAGAEFKR
ncbi:MAG: hypothetical protein DCC64_15490 [Planctomycetota bacterium]|nr:MAG: hypothetical protein DCC64_15490 [Planctomycetota bacterium]